MSFQQDIQYADIDYMDGRRDFTIDQQNFADLPQLVDEVKAGGLRFIVILDPAIANDYDAFERGKAANVYAVWSNSSYKPDGQVDDILFGNVIYRVYIVVYFRCMICKVTDGLLD